MLEGRCRRCQFDDFPDRPELPVPWRERLPEDVFGAFGATSDFVGAGAAPPPFVAVLSPAVPLDVPESADLVAPDSADLAAPAASDLAFSW